MTFVAASFFFMGLFTEAATVDIYNSTSEFGSIAETIWLKAFNRTTHQWEAKGFGDWRWTRLSVDSTPMEVDPSKYSDVEVVGYLGTVSLIISKLSETSNESFYVVSSFQEHGYLRVLCSRELVSNVNWYLFRVGECKHQQLDI